MPSALWIFVVCKCIGRLDAALLKRSRGGKERAEYGKGLIKNLAKELEPEFGSGFGKRQLDYSKKFYLEFPIVHTLSAQLNWSQYKWLLDIADKDKREYYILESINNSWTARQMKRQIDSMLYERLLLSNDKESVLAMARKEKLPESPQEIIKDPIVLVTTQLLHQNINFIFQPSSSL